MEVVFLSITIILVHKSFLFFKFGIILDLQKNCKDSTESSCVLFTYMYTNIKELIYPQSLAWGLERGGGQLMLSQIWEHITYSKVLLLAHLH